MVSSWVFSSFLFIVGSFAFLISANSKDDKDAEAISRCLFFMCYGLCVIVFVLGLTLPHVVTSEGERIAVVVKMSDRGLFWTTHEATAVLAGVSDGSGGLSSGDFYFSIADKKVLEEVKSAMLSRRPVRIFYKEYLGSIPWRDDTGYVVTQVLAVESSP